MIRQTFLHFSLTVLISLFSFLICSAQPEISLLKPGTDAEGQVYYLPKTAIRLHLLVEKTSYTPGEYARYAERYLQLKDVQQEPQVSHQLINYQLSTIGVRDTSKCYILRMKGKAETASVKLSDDGILLAVNSEPIAPVAPKPFVKSQRPKAKSQQPDYLSAEVMAAGSSAKKAELIARELLEMREQRRLLVTGEADEMPQDEQQLRLMLHEIDEKDRQLTALFTGTVQRDTSETVVTYCPEKEVEREVIFRLSRRLGIVDSDDLAGVPYYITIKNSTPQLPDSVEAINPADDKKRYTRKYKGFFVNVPTKAEISLYQEDQFLDSFEKSFAQFGTLELRDGQLFKRYVTHMQLDPATGGVVTFEVEGDQ